MYTMPAIYFELTKGSKEHGEKGGEEVFLSVMGCP